MKRDPQLEGDSLFPCRQIVLRPRGPHDKAADVTLCNNYGKSLRARTPFLKGP